MRPLGNSRCRAASINHAFAIRPAVNVVTKQVEVILSAESDLFKQSEERPVAAVDISYGN